MMVMIACGLWIVVTMIVDGDDGDDCMWIVDSGDDDCGW